VPQVTFTLTQAAARGTVRRMTVWNDDWRATHSVLLRRRGAAVTFRVMLVGTAADGWARTRGALRAEFRVRDGEWAYLPDPDCDAVAVEPLGQEGCGR